MHFIPGFLQIQNCFFCMTSAIVPVPTPAQRVPSCQFQLLLHECHRASASVGAMAMASAIVSFIQTTKKRWLWWKFREHDRRSALALSLAPSSKQQQQQQQQIWHRQCQPQQQQQHVKTTIANNQTLFPPWYLAEDPRHLLRCLQ